MDPYSVISISVFLNMFLLMALFMFLALTMPVTVPYLGAKLTHSDLLLIKRENGNWWLKRAINEGSCVFIKKKGTFLHNPKAAGRLGGVPMYATYEGLAVPPTPEACTAAEKLEAARFIAQDDLKNTAEAAARLNILKQFDVTALKQYANAVSPEGVDRRIEQRAAEMFRQLKNPLPQILAYGTFLMMFIIVASIAYSILTGGASSGESLQGVAETVTGM